jgi:hypothetical protein
MMCLSLLVQLTRLKPSWLKDERLPTLTLKPRCLIRYKVWKPPVSDQNPFDMGTTI